MGKKSAVVQPQNKKDALFLKISTIISIWESKQFKLQRF